MLNIEGKEYIYPKDIKGIPYNTLLQKIHRGRKPNAIHWKTIHNPNRKNRKDAKVLILVSSIPDAKLREKILNNEADRHFSAEKDLNEVAKKEGLDALTETATKQTALAAQRAADVMFSILQQKIEKEKGQYYEDLIDGENKIGFCKKGYTGLYAKRLVFLRWLADHILDIKATTKTQRDFNKEYRAFRSNILSMPASFLKNILVPTTDQRFKALCDKTLKRMNISREPVFWLDIKNKNNNNADIFTKSQIDFIEKLYAKDFYSHSEIYQLFAKECTKKGWFKNRKNIPSERTIRNRLTSKGELYYDRLGESIFRNQQTPTVHRSMPASINQVWGIDSTAVNEMIGIEGKANPKQALYITKIVDYASMKILSCIAHLRGEDAKIFIEAVRSAVCATGYIPKCIQMDVGAKKKDFIEYLENHSIEPYVTIIGNARSKPIELVFSISQQQVERHLQANWNGQNRTAQSRNSQPKEDFLKEIKKNASIVDIKKAANLACGDSVDLFNNRVFKTFNNKPCNKTPNEMWLEKASASPKLNYIEMLYRFGIRTPQIQLKLSGVTTSHTDFVGRIWKNTYFPGSIKTDKGIKRAIETFLKIPHDQFHKAKVVLLIADYSSASPALAIKMHGKTEENLGLFSLITDDEKAEFISVDNKGKNFGLFVQWKKFQDGYISKAKGYCETLDTIDIQSDIKPEDVVNTSNLPNSTLDKNHIDVLDEQYDQERIDKSFKKQTKPIIDPNEPQYEIREFIDKYTGEVKTYKERIN